MRLRAPLRTLCVAAGLALSGCSATGDPLEWWNRPVFVFNEILDRVLVSQIADFYATMMPQPVQTGISNFFDNIHYPKVFLNDFLQGKVGQGAADVARFAVNSTIGIAGLVDVAVSLGLDEHDEDLGQTLAVWGVGEGAYVVLPVLGPTTLRDAPDFALGRVTSVLFLIDDPRISVSSTILDGVDERARAAGALARVRETALDPYVFTREGYRQHRRFLIYDGHPPLAEPEAGLIDMEHQ